MAKNDTPSCIDLSSVLHEFDDFGTVTDHLLESIDIIAVINYYGITELLDTIGEESLRLHLECLETDRNIVLKPLSLSR